MMAIDFEGRPPQQVRVVRDAGELYGAGPDIPLQFLQECLSDFRWYKALQVSIAVSMIIAQDAHAGGLVGGSGKCKQA
jgi:hypothetical protein